MIFHPAEIDGAFTLEMERYADERGFFARLWDREELAAQGLAADLVQANLSYCVARGTLRGLHYQAPPHAEAKLVRCSRGAIYDVIADTRPGSPSFMQWMGVRLTPEDACAVYAPEGCAHGYLALEDDTEVTYFTSRAYAPVAERGLRYNDPGFNITWPAPVEVISEKDRAWADFSDEHAAADPSA